VPSRPKGKAAVAQKAEALERLEVEYVPTESIQPNAYNPNRQADREFQLLLRSMREDGFTQPVVVLRDRREIVDGEHRWRAAKELGMPEIPVVFVDMDEAQMRLSTLRHNRARGSEDLDLTTSLFRDLRELGALDSAQDALGLDSSDLERILDDSPASEALAGDEFGQAWEPTGTQYARAEFEESVNSGTPRLVSGTPGALAELERGQAAADAAGTEPERVAALRSRGVYRLALTYSSQDAIVVRQVLGDQPAARVVELCRARLPAPA
jgi:hypothetical protein